MSNSNDEIDLEYYRLYLDAAQQAMREEFNPPAIGEIFKAAMAKPKPKQPRKIKLTFETKRFAKTAEQKRLGAIRRAVEKQREEKAYQEQFGLISSG